MEPNKFRNATSYSYSPGYTFPGNLPTELFRHPSIGSPPLSDIFTIRQGIRTDEWLVLVNNMEKILKAATGCNPSYTTAGTLSDRKITVGKFEANQQWCKSDFIATASALSNDPKFVGNGLDGYDVSAAVRTFWMEEMIDAIRRDYFRIMWFGNDTSGNADYNVLDGLMVKLYDGGASYCVKRVGNDLPNIHNAVLTTDQAYNAIRALHQGAQINLKQLPPSEKVFWVTGSFYENLLTSYESKTNGATELQFKMILEGVSYGVGTNIVKSPDGGATLTFRGVPVIPLYLLDNYLQDSTNPWYDNLKDFAVYTTSGKSKYANLVLGTEVASDLDRIDMFYWQKDKVTYAQHESRAGVQYINCDLIAFYD